MEAPGGCFTVCRTPETVLEGRGDPFGEVRDHVLLRWAPALDEAAAHVSAALTDAFDSPYAHALHGER